MAAIPEGKALLDKWRMSVDIKDQYDALEELFANNIFPSEDHPTWESEGGLYPDPQIPRPTAERGEWQAWYEDTIHGVSPGEDFLPKLMRKREFQESLQPAITDLSVDKCRISEDFQITPVQRFVSRLLSPRTPYMSALLYHGVGVGKTCAAITVCESYLEMYPDTKVCIIAPPNIQEGFRRTIFDVNSLKIGVGKEENSHNGCTGNIYLSLTNSFNEKNPKVIDTRVEKSINSRYEFFGYTSFYNNVQRLLKSLEKRRASESVKREVLRNEFSNRIFIIDEAHNLRDNPDEKEEDVRDDVNEHETAEARAGKRLTPYLREILMVCEGITLVLMTATPMYNSYIEIIFLLNLLLLNDKFATLRVSDIFERDGSFTASGERILGKVSSYYISFMRGENPLSFPLRLEPHPRERLLDWPSQNPKGEDIPRAERERLVPNLKAGLDKGGLPCVPCSFTPEIERFYKGEADEIVKHEQGLGIVAMDILIQGGNWIFPNEGEILREKIGQRGFDACFQKEKRGSAITFTPQGESDWLLRSNIESVSGKAAVVLDRLANCKGVAFVYSRFVPSGALTIALALEANGYTLWGRDVGFLSTGIQDDKGRQCAICPMRERGHTGEHAFKPAKYVLLTGSSELSPNNAASIDACRVPKNLYGGEVKVVLGSQVAGEGLDLRYIREVIVFDSWYHLNKLEQVLGRGIRNCSHALLDKQYRNCTIVLLVNKYTSTAGEVESIDMYSYRTALEKAIQAGKVLRVLKEHAIDCSLNRDSILLKGIPPILSITDSQGIERKNVDINDVPFTVMCDWLDTCEYACKNGRGDPMPPPPSLDQQDITTYDEYTARFHIHTIRSYIQDLIAKNEYYVTFDKLQLQFETIPRTLLLSILNDMVSRDTFRIKTKHGPGRIILRNGYYLFQPDAIADESIPIAIRVRHVPIPRDVFNPLIYSREKEEKPSAVGEQAFSILAPADDTSEGLWEEVKDWVADIATGDASVSTVPDQVLYELQQLKASSGIYEGQKEKFEKILWLYESISQDDALRKKYAKVVLKYVWDEYITTAKKRELLAGFSTDELMEEVAEDSYWKLEGKTYLRVINTETNTLEYLCAEGDQYKICSPAIVSVLTRERGKDPLLETPITTATTGVNYGFLIFSPKKKSLVFKKGRPPLAGGKLQRGAECANNSSTSSEIEALKQYGTILRREGLSDMGLHSAELARRTIENSLRVCTVVDLTLRMMDELKVQGKRWFYRAIQSHLVGHPLR